MSHVRTQIRSALVATLTGLTTTGARVYVNRARPIAAAELPALVVRVRDEQIDATTIDWPPLVTRRVDLEVEILASGDTAADTVDASLVEVETAITATEAAGTLGGLLNGPLELRAIEALFDDEVSPPLAALRLAFVGEYATRADQPETAL